MRMNPTLVVCCALVCASSSIAHAQDEEGGEVLMELSLEDLLNLQITTASATAESILDAPAPMFVLTKQEIRDRGYTQWSEILRDLPGFDVAYCAENFDIAAYGARQQRVPRAQWQARR